MPHKRGVLLLVFALLVVAGGVLSGCGSSTSPEDDHDFAMAPLTGMPMDVQNAPVVVRQAYQFAAANPDVMKQMPCYCGCGQMGHTSNYACYVAEAAADGAITYDPHALGCSICVDITQDTIRLLKQGKSVQEIRAYVDSTYSKFGP